MERFVSLAVVGMPFVVGILIYPGIHFHHPFMLALGTIVGGIAEIGTVAVGRLEVEEVFAVVAALGLVEEVNPGGYENPGRQELKVV